MFIPGKLYVFNIPEEHKHWFVPDEKTNRSYLNCSSKKGWLSLYEGDAVMYVEEYKAFDLKTDKDKHGGWALFLLGETIIYIPRFLNSYDRLERQESIPVGLFFKKMEGKPS